MLLLGSLKMVAIVVKKKKKKNGGNSNKLRLGLSRQNWP
jgi:hypothetical protein